MIPKTRVAVVGCGVLGTRHARIYNEINEVALVTVCDRHAEKAETLAKELGCASCTHLDEIIGQVDAASICTPARNHFEVSQILLNSSNHLLIEKPITTNLQEADELVRIAQERNLVLQTGHVERYNSAFKCIKALVRDPLFIECDRIGPYDPRVCDVGVVLDLMIHDIDIVLNLVPSAIKNIDVVGLKMVSETEDFVNARLTFLNGAICSLTASRMARDRMRKLRIFQKNGYVTVDYMRQSAQYCTQQNGQPHYEVIDIPKTEPLRDEIVDFIKCVRGHAKPPVTGIEGRAALEVALRILEQIQAQSGVHVSK